MILHLTMSAYLLVWQLGNYGQHFGEYYRFFDMSHIPSISRSSSRNFHCTGRHRGADFTSPLPISSTCADRCVPTR
jgi:hypothetical protein